MLLLISLDLFTIDVSFIYLFCFEKGVAGGVGPAVVPVSVASPPMVTFVDPERSPGVLPLPPPDAQAMPPQEPMSVPPPGYYSAPPGESL